MARTNLEPPQITEISLRLQSRTGRPPALSVVELADTIGPTMRPAGESEVV